ncbi:MAG: hypothetical protein ABIR24_08945 [Verrucomicrobiota bacterium]
MNDIPPIIPNPASPIDPAHPPLGKNPEEQIPITGVASAIEAILRQPRRVLFQLRQPKQGSLIAGMLIIALVCSAIYGVVVGTFSGHEQLWAAPAKIAVGLLISALICLPSLYIFSCLSGSEARLGEVCGLVAGLLALMTILLIGFAPVAWIFSQSTESLAAMGTLHLVFWFIATGFGLRFLQTGFAHMNAKTNSGFKVWTVIFLLVMLQMTAALRPIVGTAPTLLPTEKKFFLNHWADCLNKSSATWSDK